MRAVTIIEALPGPIPRDRPPFALVHPIEDDWEDTEIWELPSPEPAPQPDMPPGPDSRADTAPF
ncbi:MAG: hypothetical protein M3228_08090 [Actinomycetota bacterium]|nr:hypothetical protein [Actinomycetota bacterium]